MNWQDLDTDAQNAHLLELLQAGRGDRGVGSIYYVACPSTGRLKIGYTAGKVEQRIRALQTGSASELRLIAMRPGTIDDEAALHHHFRDTRVHGEWFDMSEYLFDHLTSVIWCAASVHVKQETEFPDWLRCGVLMLKEHFGEIPDYFEERI